MSGRDVRLRRRRREGAERPFGIDRAAPVEQPPFAPHREIAAEGVDVTEQHHVARAVPDDADGVVRRRRRRRRRSRARASSRPANARRRLRASRGWRRRPDRTSKSSTSSIASARSARSLQSVTSCITSSIASTIRRSSSGVMISGGSRRRTVFPATSASTPRSCKRLNDRRDPPAQFDADHQARAAHLAGIGQIALAQFAEQPAAQFRRARRRVDFAQRGQRRDRRRARQRIAAEGAAVRPRLDLTEAVAPGDHAHRHAARDALCRAPRCPAGCRRAGSRTSARCVPSPVWISSTISSAPRSSHRRAQALHEFGRRRVDAAFALHRLDDDRGGLVGDGGFGGGADRCRRCG